MNIEEGDLVQLKTGGPVMYVVYSVNPDAVHCSWYMGKGEPHKSGTFSSHDLVIKEKYPVLHVERDY
jgi:uncharacterized protein YodC (DUF2158 family)